MSVGRKAAREKVLWIDTNERAGLMGGRWRVGASGEKASDCVDGCVMT